MRIVLINQFYPPDTAATGQLLSDVAEGLAARGHEVHVVCSRRSYDGGATRYAPRETRRGVHVHRVPAFGFTRKRTISRVIDYVSFYLSAICKVVCLGRMDACLALTTPPYIGLIGAALKVRGTRLIIWSMDLYPEVAVAYGTIPRGGVMHRLLARISRALYRRCDAVLSLGEVMAERLRAAGAPEGRIVTVHNWAPAESIRPLNASAWRTGWDDQPDVMTVMYSGNIGLGHEIETCLRAIRLMPERHRLRLVIVGRGRMRDALQQLARELGLEQVRFHDPLPLEHLSDALAAGDVHVVSQREGTQGLIVPSKLYGVLAAARAVLFIGPSDTEGAHILAESGAGRVVGCGNAQGVAEALREWMEQPALRRSMGEAGRNFYEKRFAMRHGVETIAACVEQSIASKAGGHVPIRSVAVEQ